MKDENLFINLLLCVSCRPDFPVLNRQDFFCVLESEERIVTLQDRIVRVLHIKGRCGQLFAQLHPLLVVGVDIPQEPLEHNLVLEVGKEGAQILRGKPVAIEESCGSLSREAFIDICIRAPFCKCCDLGDQVGIQLGL